MDKVRFLMSDTSADVTAACREALEQKGVEVTVVEKDGLQILQKMLVVRPQVVLLDAFMPGLDALAVKQKYVAAGETDTLNSYFGYTIHNLRGKPTNSEFIAMIADKMRLDKRQQAG